MRFRDWYFQGWERRTDENGKSTFVYTGEVYTFPGGIRTARRLCLTLSAALIVVYGLVALLPSEGGMWHVAAIPQLIELIPLIYLVMGLARLLTVKEPLTYRDHHASWRRLGSASVGSTVLTACMAAAEIIYIVLYVRSGFGPELLYLLGELSCFALSLALARYIRKHPCIPSVQTDKE